MKRMVTLLYSISLLTYATGTYFVGPLSASWEDAKQYCESQGSGLASIHSIADKDETKSLCVNKIAESGGRGCWIGLSDEINEDVWIWSDGSPSDYGFNPDGTATTSVIPWAGNQPNGLRGENCAHINLAMAYDWNSQPCHDPNYPMCGSAPEKDCVLNTNEICSEIELNTDRIDSANDRIDTIDGALNTRIDTLSSTLNGRIDSVESTLNGRIDTVNGRINTLRDYLQGIDAAHAFNGDIIPDNKSIPGDLFEFSKT
eukprot:21613_1